ncbi:MAG: type I-C CRISPR-associated protein Cas8c/Csd1, partial [Firmicutes bacterium]|nr:type I-C CRISPR-associated protein Cas8c/Csd1 [Bacillota bacterium]
MLESLVNYAQRCHLVTEPGYAAKYVRWAIDLDAQGVFMELEELGTAGKKGNRGHRFERAPFLSHSELITGSVRRSQFLIETLDVIAPTSVTSLQEKHQYFVHSLSQAAVYLPELKKVYDFLETPSCLQRFRQAIQKSAARPLDKATFRVNG